MASLTPLPDAFYLPAGDGVFDATHATQSPWDPAAQHGGPPSALLARCMGDALPDQSLRLGRLTVDFLGPIPLARCEVDVTVTRPGRRISRTEATLRVDGQPVVSASAWFIAAASQPPTGGWQEYDVLPLPAEQEQHYFTGLNPDWGYGRATEWRFASGNFAEAGAAVVWARPRLPLIAGRELTGQDRAVIVADSANGISNELPIGKWLFIPPTMTYTSLRQPSGEWVMLDARTTIAPDGGGLTQAVLGDTDGICGTVAQPLLVTEV